MNDDAKQQLLYMYDLSVVCTKQIMHSFWDTATCLSKYTRNSITILS